MRCSHRGRPKALQARVHKEKSALFIVGVSNRTFLLIPHADSAPTGRGWDRSELRRHRMTDEVAIYSAQDDVRLLLRGLLRLHRYRVAGEGSAPAALLQLPKDSRAVVVVDADLDEVGWSEAVAQLHRARPDQRVVLLSATRSPRVDSQARALGISAVVRRPFAVHQLMEAVTGPEGPDLAPRPPERGADAPVT